MTTVMTITTRHDITAQMCHDLFVTAFEGGCGYWLAVAELTVNGKAVSYQQEASFKQEWTLTGMDAEDLDEFFGPVTRKEFLERIAAHAKETPVVREALRDWLDENLDADSADVLMQTGLLDEITYG